MIAVSNYASVIRTLQLIILGVTGLFLLRVMRVAIVETRPPRDEKAPRRGRARRKTTLGLEFIEPDSRGGERLDVDSVLTIGRGADCDVTLDDTYLSTRHAKFTFDDGDLLVEDLGSTNGTYVNQTLIAHRTRVERGDIVQVGGVLFEVVR